MENVPRGSDGRRLFTPEFKREQVARLVRGELTLTELSRELEIARSVLQRWKHLIAQGGETAVAANGDVVPANELRAAQQKIRELERLIGKQTVDLEILRAARDEVKKATLLRSVQAMTGRPITRLCRVLGISRASAYRDRKPRARRYHRADDATVHAQLKDVLRDRGSYGYRRARVLVNRQFETNYNRKWIQRVMRLAGLAVPVRRRVRNPRAHRGKVICAGSNQRWCSDTMTIVCWNGEVVELAFALDCCDREAISHVAEARPMKNEDIRRLMRQAVFARFGNERPTERLEWLSDNGSVSTSLETVIESEKLG